MDYEIVYDEAYIKQGFIIYNKNEKQFLKIIPNISDKAFSFTLFISDDKIDNPKIGFRQIRFDFNKDTFLYELFKQVKDKIIYSTNTSLEGYNQLRGEENEETLSLVFIKDLTFSKNLNYNAMSLTVSSQIFYDIYQKLIVSNEVKYENSNKVLEKMINLKAA